MGNPANFKGTVVVSLILHCLAKSCVNVLVSSRSTVKKCCFRNAAYGAFINTGHLKLIGCLRRALFYFYALTTFLIVLFHLTVPFLSRSFLSRFSFTANRCYTLPTYIFGFLRSIKLSPKEGCKID